MPMTHPTTSSTTPGAAPRPGLRGSGRARQAGFNFTEVLFAVMILGIGFIMVAAIFPVAIQQTKLTGEEVQATTTARGGVNYAEQLGLTADALPVTIQTTPLLTIPANSSVSVPGFVSSFRDERIVGMGGMTAFQARDRLWRQVSGNLILPSDNRAAMVTMFRRGATFHNTTGSDLAHTAPGVLYVPHPYAQVYMVGVQVRNRSTFEIDKDTRRYPNDGPNPIASAAPATLEPRMVFVQLHERDLEPDRITFHETTANNSPEIEVEAAAEDAYVIISFDNFPANADGDSTTAFNETFGVANGRIYRLGAKVEGEVGTWELAPGDDMKYVQRPGFTPPEQGDIHENIPPRRVGDPPNGHGPGAIAFIVGRGYTDPVDPYFDDAEPGAGYSGLSMTTGVYTCIVPAN